MAGNGYEDEYRKFLVGGVDVDIFEKEPVPLKDFLYDKGQLNIGIKLSDIQYDAIAHASQIYRVKDIIKLGWKPVRCVNEVYLQWGKGGGKDLISMLTLARIADLLECLRVPQSYWGFPLHANIDMVNMAYNADQAKYNFFEPFKRLLGRSKRFNNIMNTKDKCIEFAKGIYAHSGHSDEDAAEGKTLIAAVLDEISAFKTRQESSKVATQVRAPRYSYEALVDTMKSSIESRVDTGKLIAISFPRYKGDAIQQLYASGLQDNKERGEKSTVYVSKACTWEANPNKRKEQFEDEMRKNPARVKARYMCEPSQAEDSYIKNIELIEEVFPDVKEENIVHTDDYYPHLKSGVRCRHNFACAAHIDLGLSTCRAGLALVHQYDSRLENVVDADTGETQQIELPLLEIDMVLSFQAPTGQEIDFGEIRKFLFDLRNAGYRISTVSYDQWQSVGERQTLEKAGFNVVRRSVDVDRSMYDDLKNAMLEHRIRGGYAAYRNYVVGGQGLKLCVIKEELQGLVDLRGKRVDHRPGGSKDESDALAGAVRGAIEFGTWDCGAVSTPDVMKNGSVQAEVTPDDSLVARLRANAGMDATSPVGFQGDPF